MITKNRLLSNPIANTKQTYHNFRNLLTKKEKDTGFSIIEMTVALTIIMIVTAISVIGYTNYRQANIDSSVEADVRSAVVKVETWKSLNPRGEPNETTIAGLTPSEPETTITITSLGNGEYEIRGCNSKGKSTKPAGGGCVVGSGYAFNSINDHL